MFEQVPQPAALTEEQLERARLNRERAQRLREEKLRAKKPEEAAVTEDLDSFFTQSHHGGNSEEIELMREADELTEKIREEKIRVRVREERIRSKIDELFNVTHAESYFAGETDEDQSVEEQQEETTEAGTSSVLDTNERDFDREIRNGTESDLQAADVCQPDQMEVDDDKDQ